MSGVVCAFSTRRANARPCDGVGGKGSTRCDLTGAPARHRESYRRNDWLTPDQVYRFEIDLWDTAWRFEPGHCIRLEVASANFPRFDRNMNIAAPPGAATLAEAVVAEQTVYHDQDRPSALVLHVPEST